MTHIPLQLVYDLYIQNDRCTASRLSSLLNAQGYFVTEATASARLNQAIVAASSGALKINAVKPEDNK